MRALLVSRSAIARRILGKILEDLLIGVVYAKDVREALNIAEVESFDLAVMDVDEDTPLWRELVSWAEKRCKGALIIVPPDMDVSSFAVPTCNCFTYLTRPGTLAASVKEIEEIVRSQVRRIFEVCLDGHRSRQVIDTSDFVPSTDERYVLIGASTGGPGLIETIARSLPADYPYPVCVVQHMPSNFTARFAERLNSVSRLKVVEAKNGEVLEPGKIIIAKGGYHLNFSRDNGRIVCRLVPNVPRRFFVPSVDEMFFSALEVMDPKKIVAVVLTGIGDDGADGMVALKKHGAYTIAESEETAVVYGMPKEAALRGGAVKVLPFPEIVRELIRVAS